MVNRQLKNYTLNLLSTVAMALGVVTNLLCAGCDSSAPLRSISVNPASAVVSKGLTDQMAAIGTLADGTFMNVTDQAQWTSSNTAVAIVSSGGDSAGLVAGVAPGPVTISARLNGITGSTQLQVR